ncbi:efflux RND transporter permease subunit [Idiomarina xiamenensis]|uniref:RND family efflux transporter n=1 Tax=Idiomarina xiamenensis 10-D-4 TaxID=740709 RepID=K2KBV1_9GAMM|nr:efflux RND transporter permease subunit [Idiomarina xiamenensis]EKE85303.1 RND family efflux transporter [Idiomarina xiamenensis 10-D-4]
MDIARYSIERKTSSWILLLVLLLGGSFALLNLGRLEDPEFTIKQAMVITSYPGASAQEVEEEVTYRIENAIQALSYIDNIKSISQPGLSQITVEMQSTYRSGDLPQIWDELRRKVNDVQSQLPPGVNAPIVKDDFADVYGVLLALTGPGYGYQDLEDFAKYLRRELVLIPGVGKVVLEGTQQEQVVVEASRNKMANYGIPPDRIAQLLTTQNAIADAGRLRIDDERLRISTSGEFSSVDELANLVVSNPGAKERIYLRDVARVYRDYQEIPDHLVHFDGKPALWLGLSFAKDVNVVDVGQRLQQRLAELDYAKPVGMQLDAIYNQPQEVESSVSNFLLNLVEAVVIVIVALLLTMGLRSGLLIGMVLLLTVLGTFIFMYVMGINLQRVSLGALIIALGMLVDNAIVVAEGMLVGMRRGMSKAKAASQVVEQNKWPLFGATVIAIIAFAPIGLSKDASGEFAGSLFWVLFISLLLSWFTAITLTPFLGHYLYRQDTSAAVSDDDDVYRAGFYQRYRRVLQWLLHHRGLTGLVLLGLLVVAVAGFGQVKQAFFPPSTTPMFYVDLWYPQGTDIRTTSADVKRIEQFVLKQPEVKQVATTIGRGAPRFTLTYMVEKSYESYAQLIIRARDREQMEALLPRIRRYIYQHHPQVEDKLLRMEIGPSTPAKIEARFSGADPLVLRQLAEQAKAVLRADPGATNIRDDWRQRTKLLQPRYNEAAGRRLGISREDVSDVLKTNFVGRSVGIYRDGTQLLPIIVRAPLSERADIDNWQDLQVFSDVLAAYVPLTQVVNAVDLRWENNLILRRDRKRTLTVMADPDALGDETAAQLFDRVHGAIEAIELPLGYQLTWGGEHEAAGKAEKAVFGAIPLGVLAMVIITVLLFNSARLAVVLWTAVPLSIIGVTLGLLVMNKPFGFMALLGFLSLSGMLLKNGIVLLEQIAVEREAGKAPYRAVVDAAVSRVRPVGMAAATTILGMLPLLFDDFFASMAVVIMFGLGFATLLTLLIVPLMYAMVMRVENSPKNDRTATD